MDGCQECLVHDECLVCDNGDNYELNLTTNTCQCKLLYFRVGLVCMNCSTSCLCNGWYWEGPVCQTRCGDKILVYETEECDDGNTVDGDGCSSTCKQE